MRGFFTLLITLCSLTGYSQKFMVGAHGGVMYNTTPIGTSEYFSNFKSRPQMVVGGKLGIDTRKIQIGLACNVSSIAHTRDMATKGSAPQFSYEYSASVVNPYLFLNFKKNFIRSFLYFGVNAGFVNVASGKDVTTYKGQSFGTITYPDNGFSAGLQAAARIKIAEGLGVLAEAALHYNTASPAMVANDSQGQPLGSINGDGFFSFPLTLGFDYIF